MSLTPPRVRSSSTASAELEAVRSPRGRNAPTIASLLSIAELAWLCNAELTLKLSNGGVNALYDAEKGMTFK